jgi:hypothetical protein
MADGLRLVPIEAKVAAGDREVGGDGQLFAGARAQEGAVIANPEAQGGGGGLGGAGADLAEDGQFPLDCAS